MSRLVKVIDNETIEIAEYRCPEVIFKSSQNPPTLQDTRNEIEHLEWYCTFKDTINPFQIYEENHRLNNIINELEQWLEESIEKHTEDYLDWKYDKNVYLAGSKKLQNVLDKLQELKGSDK